MGKLSNHFPRTTPQPETSEGGSPTEYNGQDMETVVGWQGLLLNPTCRRELVELDKARRRFLWAGDLELTGPGAGERLHGRRRARLQ